MNNGITMQELEEMFANPLYAINISEVASRPHEVLISPEDWVAVAKRSILEDDSGAAMEFDPRVSDNLTKFLWRLLDNLQSDQVPYGYSDGTEKDKK